MTGNAIMALVPITVPLPVTAILDQAVVIPAAGTFDIVEISASLQALTSGTLGLRLKDQNGNVVETLSFSGTGKQTDRKVLSSLYTIPYNGFMQWDVTGLGLLPVGLYATIWGVTY